MSSSFLLLKAPNQKANQCFIAIVILFFCCDTQEVTFFVEIFDQTLNLIK